VSSQFEGHGPNDAMGKHMLPRNDAALFPKIQAATAVTTQHVIRPMVAVGIA